MQMLRNLKAKLNFIFPAPIPCPKNVSAPLVVPLADALHCYAFAPHLRQFLTFCVQAQGTLTMQLLVVNR